MNWVNAIVQGILLGGQYALFACGLALMFGVMRIINLAHGDIAVLGAFLITVVLDHANISPFLALLPVLPVMLVGGYLLQRTMLGASWPLAFSLPPQPEGEADLHVQVSFAYCHEGQGVCVPANPSWVVPVLFDRDGPSSAQLTATVA